MTNIQEITKKPEGSNDALSKFTVIPPNIIYKTEEIKSILDSDELVIAAIDAGPLYLTPNNFTKELNSKTCVSFAAISILCTNHNRNHNQIYNSYPIALCPYQKLPGSNLNTQNAENAFNLAMLAANQFTTIGYNVSFLVSNTQNIQNGKHISNEYKNLAKTKGIKLDEPFPLCLSQQYMPSNNDIIEINILDPPKNTKDPYIIWRKVNQIIQNTKSPRTKNKNSNENLKNATEAYLNNQMTMRDFYEYFTKMKYTRKTHQEYTQEKNIYKKINKQ